MKKKWVAALLAVVLTLSGSTQVWAAEDFVDSTSETEEEFIQDSEIVDSVIQDGIAIDESNFPDASFREIVQGYDTNENGYLSQSEIEVVLSIHVYNQGIQDFTGIEYFTNLESLYCYNDQLATLDLSNNLKLEILMLSNTQLGCLDISKNINLRSLFCDGNQLTNLDVSNNLNLGVLTCGDNQLTFLDVSNNLKLHALDCSGNQLTKLDISHNPEMTVLDVEDNQLGDLDVSNNLKLRSLWCTNNHLTSLNVNNNKELVTLRCSNNQIAYLDLSNNEILPERQGSGTSLHGSVAGAFVTPQHISCNTTRISDAWTVDLAGIVGSENLDRVTIITEGAELLSNGLVTFSGSEMPKEFVYNYDTGNPGEDTLLTVYATLNGISSKTDENVFIDTNGIDWNRIYEDYNLDPEINSIELVLLQETPALEDTEKLTQQASIDGYSTEAVFEILMALYVDGEKVAELTEDFGTLEMDLYVGKDFADCGATVYQLHNDEDIIIHNGATVDLDGTVSITVDKLSTFAVAIEKLGNEIPTQTPTITKPTQETTSQTASNENNAKNINSVKTGDSINFKVWIAICILAFGVVIFLVKGKSCKKF